VGRKEGSRIIYGARPEGGARRERKKRGAVNFLILGGEKKGEKGELAAIYLGPRSPFAGVKGKEITFSSQEEKKKGSATLHRSISFFNLEKKGSEKVSPVRGRGWPAAYLPRKEKKNDE